MRKRASVLLYQDNSLLLIFRRNQRGEYYIFPGGGIEEGESSEQAATREMKEEAGINVEVMRHFCEYWEPDGSQQTFFMVCNQLDDKQPAWQEVKKQSEEEYYELRWVKLKDLGDVIVYPEVIKQKITNTTR